MAFSTAPLTPPDAADYQRMGLRPLEFRPLVIRRALERSAQPLALMHLRSPSDDIERLLLGVMVSAYRVLDPRRREDAQSRIMLGRIHPQLADEAVQVAQARLNAPQSGSLSRPTGASGSGVAGGANATSAPPVSETSERPGRWKGEEDFLPSMLAAEQTASAAPTLEVQLSTSERFLDAAMTPGWDLTLRSSDLLVQPVVQRCYRAVRRRIAMASAPSLTAVAMLAATVLMVSTWRTTLWLRDSGGPARIVHAAEPMATEAQVSGRATTAAASVTAAPQALATAAVGTIADAVELSSSTPPPAGQISGAAERVVTGSPTSPVAIATAETIAQGAQGGQPQPPHGAPEPAGVAQNGAIAELSGGGGSGMGELGAAGAAANLAAAAVGVQTSRPDLRVDAVGDNAAEQTPGLPGEPSAPVVAAQAQPEIVVTRPPVPPEPQQAAARLRVEMLVRSQQDESLSGSASGDPAPGGRVPADAQAGDVQGAAQQIARLQAVAAAAQADSPERWVAWILTAQAGVLADRPQDTEQAVVELTQGFEISTSEAVVRLARWAAGDVVTDQQRQSVAGWIEQKIRRFVTDGNLVVAGQLVGVAQELGLKHRDEPIKAQSKLWREALAVAQRYADAAHRLQDLTDAGQASAEQRAMAGRYWALVRRDWHRALPHLAAGNNAKLASLAGIELLSGGALDAQDATLLADGYLGEAKRAKGWLGDSYILHAHELLLAAAQGASESKSLELARAAEELKSQYARTFAEAAATTATRPEISRDVGGGLSSGEPAENPSASPSDAVMLGRVRIAGQDIGALVRYEQGMTLGSKLIDQIANQLSLSLRSGLGPVASVEIEFLGMISVDRPTTVSVNLLPLSDAAVQQIAIGGQVLPLEQARTSASAQRYDVELLGGEYLIRWTATLAAEDRLALRILDQSSGQTIPVAPPPPETPGHPERLPTRLRVSLVAEQ